jgi:hypothetical protein
VELAVRGTSKFVLVKANLCLSQVIHVIHFFASFLLRVIRFVACLFGLMKIEDFMEQQYNPSCSRQNDEKLSERPHQKLFTVNPNSYTWCLVLWGLKASAMGSFKSAVTSAAS